MGQIDEVAEPLGQFSCGKMEMSGNIQRMYDGTYKLALELIDVQVELGQIDKFAELLGELSCAKT